MAQASMPPRLWPISATVPAGAGGLARRLVSTWVRSRSGQPALTLSVDAAGR